jgi:HPr kinase/phosphorylase
VPETVHATVVAVDGKGVLLRGPSGSGKSDLALRLIDGGASLVADDRTELRVEAGQLVACAPSSIMGKIEIRGIGIVNMPALERVVLCLAVELVSAETERLPRPETIDLLGIRLPMIRLSAFQAATPAKIRLAVRTCDRDIER